jgi:cytochrome c5
MHKIIRLIVIALITAPFLTAAQSSNVTLPQDKGPASINVASYPPEQQKGYKVFADKCAKCHTLARPVNTTMTKQEWERYVKRMMHKPNSGIGDSQGKTIYEFLVYDQEQRKDKNPSAFFKSLSDEEIEKLKAQQN